MQFARFRHRSDASTCADEFKSLVNKDITLLWITETRRHTIRWNWQIHLAWVAGVLVDLHPVGRWTKQIYRREYSIWWHVPIWLYHDCCIVSPSLQALLFGDCLDVSTSKYLSAGSLVAATNFRKFYHWLSILNNAHFGRTHHFYLLFFFRRSTRKRWFDSFSPRVSIYKLQCVSECVKCQNE